MIYTPKNLNDPILNLIRDDPVRPDIPVESRIGDKSEILISMKDDKPTAVLCVTYTDMVPASVKELFHDVAEVSTVIFYTIWSYIPGAGRDLVFDAVSFIRDQHPEVRRFITLSPKTEMARKFHLRNGAVVYRENEESVNYEYNVIKPS